jgi:hypothetical protein
LVTQVRDTYNVPNDIPREAIWHAIAGRLDLDAVGPERERGVVDLARVRRSRQSALALGSGRPFGWAVAAAAVLVLGIGIGRASLPGTGRSVTPAGVNQPGMPAANALATRDYLGQAESLLSMVRVDGRDGRVDPATTEWARGLLAQTRLLIDAGAGSDPAVSDLLLDLELVLAQIAGVRDVGMDEARERTELDLAIRGMEQGEVLPRIQAVLPLERAGA